MVQRRTGKRSNKKRKVVARTLLIICLVVGVIAWILHGLEQVKIKQGGKHTPISPAEKKVTPTRKTQPRIPRAPHRNYSSPAPRLVPYTEQQSKTLPPRQEHMSGSGFVAIIIDDMGAGMAEARTLLSLNIPLTFSIIPGLLHDQAVAIEAHRHGYEVMVHLPMQPKGYPAQKLEHNGLLVEHSSDEIGRRVREYLTAVPYAVGANNHMGSEFTEHPDKMRPVLDVLQKNGLYFIDSKTTPASVGATLGREMGLATGSRQVFLDNVQDVEAIRAQILKLAQSARKHGSAIGICHPHPATLKALTRVLPALQREGITFVYASKLVK